MKIYIEKDILYYYGNKRGYLYEETLYIDENFKTILVIVLGLTTMIIVYFVIKMVKGKCNNAFPLIPFFTIGIIIQIFIA